MEISRFLPLPLGRGSVNEENTGVGLPEDDARKSNCGGLTPLNRKLLVVQLSVQPVQLQKLAVLALFDDSTLIEYENLVGGENGRQAVRDRKRRPPLHELIQ